MALSADEAKTRLAAVANENWNDDRHARLAALPRKLRPVAEAVFREFKWGGSPDSDAQRAFGALSARDRKRVFEAAAPGRGDLLEGAWQICERLPYQTGWGRRPFRAPGQPSLLLANRIQVARSTAYALGKYEGGTAWIAAWSGHVGQGLGPALAAAIDSGDKVVYETLVDIINGTHPFGVVSANAIRALLIAERSDGWDVIERLLLAAQRQEGIRQSVFEAIDESHPDVLSRFLHVIQEHNLGRFASAARAIAVWMGVDADVADQKQVQAILNVVTSTMADPPKATSDNPTVAYAQVWAMAVTDVGKAVRLATDMAQHADPGVRMAATHLLAQAHLESVVPMLVGLLHDPDRRVAARAFLGLRYQRINLESVSLEGYLKRIDKPRTLEPLVWEWMTLSEDPSQVIRMMFESDRIAPIDVHQHLPRMDADTRASYVRHLSQETGEPVRQAMVTLANDRAQYVTRTVFEYLEAAGIKPDEAPTFEALLTRKTGGTRSAAVTLLLNQKDKDAIASAERLLASRNRQQRLGGLDVLVQLRNADRATEAAIDLVERFGSERTLHEDEQRLVSVMTTEHKEYTLDDGLGLFDPADRTEPIDPNPVRIKPTTKGHQRLLESAVALVETYKDLPVQVTRWHGTEEELYGNIRWLPNPTAQSVPEDGVLFDEWDQWLAQASVSDFDLERCLATFANTHFDKHAALGRKLLPQAAKEIGFAEIVERSMWWLWLKHGTTAGIEFWIDGAENALAAIPSADRRDPFTEVKGYYSRPIDWRSSSRLIHWLNCVGTAASLRPDLVTDDIVRRMWNLYRWLDEPGSSENRLRPGLGLVVQARELGAATRADVIDHLIGFKPKRQGYWSRNHHADLATVSRRRVAAAHADLQPLVAEIRDRLIEVELQRGDVATPASEPALDLRSVPGADKVVELVAALGRSSLVRGWSWDGAQKASVLSKLIRVSHPAETDTPASFAELATAAKISEKRLLELAFYAPQWGRYVEHAIGWDGLDDAVYWIHAHTKDGRWSVDQDIRDEWIAEISSRTPLSANDLVDGGVDVEWFHRVLNKVGAERWETLLKYVKFASGGGGHKRAELFGEALRGQVTVKDLAKRIADKRHQDSVRALGLVPLGNEDDLLGRYQTIQEFRRGSRQFGAQRQQSEGRAADIALENLARTAGFPDPVRLQWDMEILELADLSAGPVNTTVDDYTFTLSIDDTGKAKLATVRGDKALKSVPAKHRKHPEVAAMRARSTALRKQVSRVRQSLESSAIRGDIIGPDELQRLHSHPLLRPMLGASMFVQPSGRLGLPNANGSKLVDATGKSFAVGVKGVRLAHPVDLLASDDWATWQHRFFVDELVQPFKQVFRELYVLTDAESSDGKKSSRYAGHQLNPSQARGIFSNRGWVSHPDGYTMKTFHGDGLTATVISDLGLFTPAEAESPVIEYVVFNDRDSGDLVDLTKVPPRLFSETMRDLDLVVSVAHAGGVDPEASASTTEMREALVRETAMLLGLDNVRFSSQHVIVDGSIANYSIHLGSGQVHKQPGGAVCIIPISAQHRGRLFLPFADDDPRTAEVVSKVVMLARDDRIKDPTILSQLVR